MSSLVKMVVVMTEDKARDFITQKRLQGLDTLPGINPVIKEFIRKYISDNVGYDNVPIAGLSKHNGEPSELKVVGTSVSEFIPMNPSKNNSVLFELHIPRDMAVSVSYGKLLEFSNLVKNALDEEDAKMYLEDFEEFLQIGYYEGDDEDVISFIPFIDLNRCKFYALVNQNWSIGDFSVPGVEQVKLNSMELF